MINIGISLNDNFINGALTLIYSIKKHNKFDFKLYVVDINLSHKNKLMLKLLHENIEFVEIMDKNLYDSSITLSPFENDENELCIPEGFYRFELFKLPIKQLIYFDCDMLCLGSLKELTELQDNFSACYIESPHQIIGKLQDIKSLYHFNSGMMVVGEKYLGSIEHCKELIRLISKFVPPNDEKILNYFFSCKNDVNYVDYKYNTPIGFFDIFDDFASEVSIRNNFITVLHYGPSHTFLKPWDVSDPTRFEYKLWLEYYKDTLKYLSLA